MNFLFSSKPQQQLAKNGKNDKFATNRFQLSHSWEGQNAHIARKEGKVRRCRVGKMDMNNGEVSIVVEFRGMNKHGQKTTFTKSVSPLHLLHVNDLWKSTIALSESEQDDPDAFKTRSYDYKTGENASLPSFECYNAEKILCPADIRKLNWMIQQIQCLQCLSQQVKAVTIESVE